jgi:hypothetical protein
MTHVALVTYDELPTLTPSDVLLQQALASIDIQSSPVLWDDATINWTQFDAVIIRCPWDYHERPTEFKAWIHRLAEANVTLYNSPSTLLWNMEKIYLRELAENGVQIIPTIWAKVGETIDLPTIIHQQGWDKALLKPVFGAGSKGIHVINAHTLDEAQITLNRMLTSGEVMIQPVIKEVQNGELSLIFFNHEYSHTIRKTPQNGAILLDPDNPNSTCLDDAPQFAIDAALNILEQAQKLLNEDNFLYARVDGVIVEGQFLLMELELLEPHLFLDLAGEHTAQHYAQTIQSRLNKHL